MERRKILGGTRQSIFGPPWTLRHDVLIRQTTHELDGHVLVWVTMGGATSSNAYQLRSAIRPNSYLVRADAAPPARQDNQRCLCLLPLIILENKLPKVLPPLLTLTPTITMTLPYEPDFQSPTSYDYDSYTYKISRSKGNAVG